MPHILHLLFTTPSAKANGMPSQFSKSGSYFVGVPKGLDRTKELLKQAAPIGP